MNVIFRRQGSTNGLKYENMKGLKIKSTVYIMTTEPRRVRLTCKHCSFVEGGF